MNQIKNESVDAEQLYQYFLETAEVSRAAADIFERKGWSKTTDSIFEKNR